MLFVNWGANNFATSIFEGKKNLVFQIDLKKYSLQKIFTKIFTSQYIYFRKYLLQRIFIKIFTWKIFTASQHVNAKLFIFVSFCVGSLKTDFIKLE